MFFSVMHIIIPILGLPLLLTLTINPTEVFLYSKPQLIILFSSTEKKEKKAIPKSQKNLNDGHIEHYNLNVTINI